MSQTCLWPELGCPSLPTGASTFGSHEAHKAKKYWLLSAAAFSDVTKSVWNILFYLVWSQSPQNALSKDYPQNFFKLQAPLAHLKYNLWKLNLHKDFIFSCPKKKKKIQLLYQGQQHKLGFLMMDFRPLHYVMVLSCSTGLLSRVTCSFRFPWGQDDMKTQPLTSRSITHTALTQAAVTSAADRGADQCYRGYRSEKWNPGQRSGKEKAVF